MALYDIIVDLADQQIPIWIDALSKNLKINRTIIIQNGKIVTNRFTAAGNTYEFTNLIDKEENICNLYEDYKYSVPEEREVKYTAYYKALHASQLRDFDLFVGKPRRLMQIRLEAYIMLAGIEGKLTWKDNNLWYTTGYELVKDKWPEVTEDRDFIVMKPYIA